MSVSREIPSVQTIRVTGIARALSKLGHSSRTVAARLVAEGRVSVNGRVVRDPESPVRLGKDRLCVDNIPVNVAERRYLMLNKPRGLVTSARDERDRDTVYACFKDAADAWLAPVGRLDKASEGLLFFTNDSVWAHRLTDPNSHLPKVYHVQIGCLPSDTLPATLRAGVPLADSSILRAEHVSILRQGEKNAWLEITLHEGKNRHIRRMLEALGIDVLRLVRVAIGPVCLGELPKGASRTLTRTELRALESALRRSPQTDTGTA